MKVSGNSTSQQPEPGTVNALCSRVIDMGTQTSAFGKKRKVMLGWEISQLMDDGRPFLVIQSYTASIHPKSSLGKLLEGWRGKAFTDEERNGFNLENILGKSCLLSLVQEGEYVNVASVSPLVKGMQPLQLAGSLVHFDLDNYNEGVFAGLSEKIREKISATPEYKKATGQETHEQEDAGTPPSIDDDIPF